MYVSPETYTAAIATIYRTGRNRWPRRPGELYRHPRKVCIYFPVWEISSLTTCRAVAVRPTEKMNRAKMITLRLDVDTLAAWKLAAASLNLGVSEMIRTFVAEGLKDREIR